MNSPSRKKKGQTGPASLGTGLILAGIAVIVLAGLGWVGIPYVRTFIASDGSIHPSSVPITVVDATPPSSDASSQSSDSSAVAPSPADSDSQGTVSIDGNTIDVDVATTTAEIDQGLQNRPSLGASQGMLFLFNHSAIFRFWMPNMNFPLDMIWIGSNMKVVDITKNAPPLPDPTNPVWFSPKTPAQYVLEVNAGYADAHDIQPGDVVTFSSSI